MVDDEKQDAAGDRGAQGAAEVADELVRRRSAPHLLGARRALQQAEGGVCDRTDAKALDVGNHEHQADRRVVGVEKGAGGNRGNGDDEAADHRGCVLYTVQQPTDDLASTRPAQRKKCDGKGRRGGRLTQPATHIERHVGVDSQRAGEECEGNGIEKPEGRLREVSTRQDRRLDPSGVDPIQREDCECADRSENRFSSQFGQPEKRRSRKERDENESSDIESEVIRRSGVGKAVPPDCCSKRHERKVYRKDPTPVSDRHHQRSERGAGQRHHSPDRRVRGVRSSAHIGRERKTDD